MTSAMRKTNGKKWLTVLAAAVLTLTVPFSCFATEDDDAPDLKDGEVAYVSEPVYEEPVYEEPVYEEPSESYTEPVSEPAESVSITPGQVQTVEEEEDEPEESDSGSGGSGYVSGSYSRACPNTWENTGDQCRDMIQVALTQVGYRDVSNHTKYNVWYFGYDCGESWCATFLSWCAEQAGIPSYVLAATPVASAERFGVGYRSVYYDDPQAGDLAFVENDGSNGYAGFDHVALVYYVDEDFIYTVEGNCADAVMCRVYNRDTGETVRGDGDRIVWLATPEYEDNSEPEPLPSLMDVHLSLALGEDGGAATFIEASFNGNEIAYRCSLEEPISRTTTYSLEGMIRK